MSVSCAVYSVYLPYLNIKTTLVEVFIVNTIEPLHNDYLGHKLEWPLERRGRYVFARMQHCFKKRNTCFDIEVHNIFLKRIKKRCQTKTKTNNVRYGSSL